MADNMSCMRINCPYFFEGRCMPQLDFVNRETGEPVCPRDSRAIPRREWVEQHLPTTVNVAIEKANETLGTDIPALPSRKEYLLTIRVRFNALDDPDARHVAQVSLATHGFVGADDFYTKGAIEKKLQRLSKSGPPEKVEM